MIDIEMLNGMTEVLKDLESRLEVVGAALSEEEQTVPDLTQALALMCAGLATTVNMFATYVVENEAEKALDMMKEDM